MLDVSAARPGRVDKTHVARAFDSHARTYDKLVGANPGYHEHLRMSARRMGIPNGGAGLRLLDLGCGTGASTAALLDAAPEADITAVDFSAEMLAVARRKVWPSTVRFVHGSADELERVKVTGPFDGILAAYLLRNLPDYNTSLRTFWSLLRPGAPLALHEYSVKDSLRSRMVWTSVCWSVIIPLGRIRSGDSALYRYLWRSVLEFDGVEALTNRLRATGFDDVRVQTVSGWQQHIVHTFLGRRPGGAARPVPVGDDLPGDDRDAPTPPAGTHMTEGDEPD
jgi:ubiquinone/menaquinone biosynthesis C-methylase UbiE